MKIDKEGNIIYTEDLIYELGTSSPLWDKVVKEEVKESNVKQEFNKRSDLPSPTPLRFSKAERFDG